MHITFVKKIFADGTPCKKCREVSERMDAEGVFGHINQVAIADERDPDSEGMKLARQHQVSRAPFFIVEQQGSVDVFDVYFKFKKHLVEQGIEITSASAF